MAELKTQSLFLEKPRIEELLRSKRDGVCASPTAAGPTGASHLYALRQWLLVLWPGLDRQKVRLL